MEQNLPQNYILIVSGNNKNLYKFYQENRNQDECFSLFQHKLNLLDDGDGLIDSHYENCDQLVENEVAINNQGFKLEFAKECYCTHFWHNNDSLRYQLEVDAIINRYVQYITPYYPELTFEVQIDYDKYTAPEHNSFNSTMAA